MEYYKRNKIIKVKFGLLFNNEKIKITNKNKVVLDTILSSKATTGICDVALYLKANEENKLCIFFDNNRSISFDVNNKYHFLTIEKVENNLSLYYKKYPISNNKYTVCENISYDHCNKPKKPKCFH